MKDYNPNPMIPYIDYEKKFRESVDKYLELAFKYSELSEKYSDLVDKYLETACKTDGNE